MAPNNYHNDYMMWEIPHMVHVIYFLLFYWWFLKLYDKNMIAEFFFPIWKENHDS